nr:endonuclease V-like isoform X2 [Coffea arabica]
MEENPCSETHSSAQLRDEWLEIQDSLKKKLITDDDFYWKLRLPAKKEEEEEILRHVGGVDLSFAKDDPSTACGTLVVLDLLNNLNVVYEDSSLVKLDVPYVPGFLAFREAPVLLELLEKMKKSAHPFYPQLLMVDGNGILHPRGKSSFFPLISGIRLHHVDGLTLAKVRQLLEVKENSSRDVFTLIGDSGRTFGMALRSTQGLLKPIFVSVGHRVSLATAIKVVKMTCRFRIPEPIRQADIRSKQKLSSLF